MKMDTAIIQGEQRAETQPQPAKDNDQAKKSNAATYHINDGTYSLMEEEDFNLTKSSSRDSGLNIKMSSTPIIRLESGSVPSPVIDETQETETKDMTNVECTSLSQVNESSMIKKRIFLKCCYCICNKTPRLHFELICTFHKLQTCQTGVMQ